MFTEQCSRWKHARVFQLVEANFPALADGRSFPLLETVEIRHFIDEPEYPDLHLFNSAPRLHTLKIDKLPPAEALETFTPCFQITSLIVYHGDYYDLLVLNKFSNLKSIVFAKLDVDPEIEELPPQTLPYVTTVDFQLSDFSEVSYGCNSLKMLVEKLTLPSLTTLMITNQVYDRDLESPESMFKGVWPPQSFSDFFQRSGCSLTALHLDYISIPDRELIALLRLNPSLVELRVKEICRKDYDFAAIESRRRRRRRRKRGLLPDGPFFKFEDIIAPLLLTSLHAYNHGLTSTSPLVPKLERLRFVADGFLFDDELF
ncbi:hypothetical protein D9758_014321 [Tetrapyrgos nigripes]|uniref:Uncharacterized protein n=1 Tax=Tetrapyrgos nigripes TaxID=182062 RepID=A0A8H5FIT8_9AGAR|nr:hypothetical protein D9758_014321 [Tetrapyrgos nigripes]